MITRRPHTPHPGAGVFGAFLQWGAARNSGIGAAGAAPALVPVGTCAGESAAPWDGFGLVVVSVIILGQEEHKAGQEEHEMMQEEHEAGQEEHEDRSWDLGARQPLPGHQQQGACTLAPLQLAAQGGANAFPS